jgi:signal transduction histidine kinase/ligand-binding sensor domain-containing protein
MPMMRRRRGESCALGATLVVALAATAGAQTAPIRLFTTADGLVQDTVLRITLDSRGFMWFGTITGLARFDGRRIVNYGSGDGLPDLVINHVYEDRRGALWVATNGGGLARFRATAEPGKVFDVFAVGDTRRSNRVNKLVETSDERLWAATDEGLFVAPGADAAPAFVRVPLGAVVEPGAALQLLDLTAAADGTLWLATSAGLLRRDRDGQISSYRRAAGTAIAESVTLSPDGYVWVGFNDGLGVWKQDDSWRDLLSEVAGVRLEGVRAVFVDIDGALLVGTSTGALVRMHGNDRRVLWRPTLRGTQIHDLAVDRQNHLWIGTSDGVARMQRSGLVTWPKPLSSGGITFFGLAERAPNQIYGLSAGGWLGRVKHDHLEVIQPKAVSEAFTATLMYQTPLLDRHGQWWIGTGRGLYRFDAIPFERLENAAPVAVYRTADGLPSDVVGRLFEDRHGDIWMATLGDAGEVLARWHRATNQIQTYTESDGLPARNVPLAFTEDRQGSLWSTFRDGGLGHLRPDGRFDMINDQSLARVPLHAIHFDHVGRLWLGTRGQGVVRVDAPSVMPWQLHRYSRSEGLTNESVDVILEDREGAIYVGGQRGLERIDPDTHAVHLVAPAGLVGSAHAGLVDVAGNLWVGGVSGISRLTTRPERTVPPPRVLLGAARLAGVAMPLSPLGAQHIDSIELSASRNNLQFEFFGLDQRLDGSLRYQTRLNGAADDWSTPSTDQSVTYASLAPGRYRFEVRAISADGAVSLEPATATFVVQPPLWATWWFRSAVFIGVGLMVYAWYRYRIRQVLAVERVRSRIATDLHDDIGADLSQIAILSEVVRRDIGIGYPEASRRLSSIAATASGLVDSMSDIVWAVNPGRDSMADLVHRMRRFVSDTLGGKDIAFQFNAPTDADALPLGADVRRNVFLVLKEAIHNIVRHSRATSAEIRVERDRRWLTLTVRDNGVGFDRTQPTSSTGLASMAARVAALGGTLTIDSASGAGTTVTLRVICR